MFVRKRLFAAAFSLLGAVAMAFTAAASGHHGPGRAEGITLFRSALTPSLHTDPAIHAVSPATVDWALTEGRVRLRRAFGPEPVEAEQDEEGEHGDRGRGFERHGRRERGRSEFVLQGSLLLLRLEVDGLVIRGTTNPGPLTSITASLFCGSDTTPAFVSAPTPLSSSGEASLSAPVNVSKCLSPVVLVHPSGDTTHYIAASGFGN